MNNIVRRVLYGVLGLVLLTAIFSVAALAIEDEDVNGEDAPLSNLVGELRPDQNVAKVDLTIDGVDDKLEFSKGGVVVRNYDGNNAPRKAITLSATPAGWQGNVILARNNTKVKIYDAATGGNEITFNGTDNKFAGGVLPKTLYVQGDTTSTTMRDVELQLSVDGAGDTNDTVKFTVLWVVVSGRHTPGNDFSADNAKLPEIQNITWPSIGKLGSATVGLHPDVPFAYRSGFCIFSEFAGDVAPDDFRPSDFSEEENILCMKRTLVAGKYYDGEDGDHLWMMYLDDDDTELDWQDTDPQSGGSEGMIYDCDGPGLGDLFQDLGDGEILRGRTNFVQYAQ